MRPGWRAGKEPPWFRRPGSFSSFLGRLATTLSGSALVADEDDDSDLIQHAVYSLWIRTQAMGCVQARSRHGSGAQEASPLSWAQRW